MPNPRILNQIPSGDSESTLYDRYLLTRPWSPGNEVTATYLAKQVIMYDYLFRRFLPKDFVSPMLDIGCGWGGMVSYCLKKGYTQIQGVDISKEQIQLGQKLGIEGLMLGDVLDFLQPKRDSYDVVFAIDVLEHFAKASLHTLLDAVYKALRPGGFLIAQTVNATGLFASIYAYGDYTHETFLSVPSATQVFFLSGFAELEFYPVYPIPRGFHGRLRKVLWRVEESLVRVALAVATGERDSGSTAILTPNFIISARKRS